MVKLFGYIIVTTAAMALAQQVQSFINWAMRRFYIAELNPGNILGLLLGLLTAGCVLMMGAQVLTWPGGKKVAALLTQLQYQAVVWQTRFRNGILPALVVFFLCSLVMPRGYALLFGLFAGVVGGVQYSFVTAIFTELVQKMPRWQQVSRVGRLPSKNTTLSWIQQLVKQKRP